MQTPQDRYVQIGTVNTRYWAEGNQGSAVVLIHGIGQYLETWSPSFDALATKHRVYALDLPGHGRTDKPLDASYKIIDLARFVKEFMDMLGVKRAHIVGHSLGGAIGIQLTLAHPSVVDKLALLDSGRLGKEVTMLLRIMNLPILGELLTRPNRSMSASFVKLLMHDPAMMTAELLELSYQMSLLPGAQKSFLKTVRANGNFFGQGKSMYQPILQGLSSIQNPVLLVWGREDQIIPVAHADVARKAIPNIRVHVFDNCGHFPMLEHPQAFNKLLFEFLGD